MLFTFMLFSSLEFPFFPESPIRIVVHHNKTAGLEGAFSSRAARTTTTPSPRVCGEGEATVRLYLEEPMQWRHTRANGLGQSGSIAEPRAWRTTIASVSGGHSPVRTSQ